MVLFTALALVVSYLIGSIPFSQIVGRLVKGIDLRKTGTHNVGGVNLIRNAGAGWGIVGGALDVAKGALAMWLAQDVVQIPSPLFLLAGLAVVAGHIWSIFLKFSGGKGIATSWGALAWVSLPAGILCAVVYALVHLPTHNGTTALIVAFSAVGIYFYWTGAPVAYYLVIGFSILITAASYEDLTNTAKTAKSSGSWLDNFITPKSQIGKKPTAPKKS